MQLPAIKVPFLSLPQIDSAARELLAAGSHERSWDGCDDTGRPLPAGVYLARLETLRRTLVQRVALVR